MDSFTKVQHCRKKAELVKCKSHDMIRGHALARRNAASLPSHAWTLIKSRRRVNVLTIREGFEGVSRFKCLCRIHITRRSLDSPAVLFGCTMSGCYHALSAVFKMYSYGSELLMSPENRAAQLCMGYKSHWRFWAMLSGVSEVGDGGIEKDKFLFPSTDLVARNVPEAKNDLLRRCVLSAQNQLIAGPRVLQVTNTVFRVK